MPTTAILTGTFLPDLRTAAGEPVILYTSVPPQEIEHGKNTQALATPDNADWRTWTQHVSTPFLDLATQDGPAFRRDWRDPFVFQAEGRTFLVIGAILGEKPSSPLRNPAGDLATGLSRHHPRTAPNPFLECPNLIRLSGNKWVLLTTLPRRGMVQWHAGSAFHIERRGRLTKRSPLRHPSGHRSDRSHCGFGCEIFPKRAGTLPRRAAPSLLDAAGDANPSPKSPPCAPPGRLRAGRFLPRRSRCPRKWAMANSL
jgi:hypothetical protein